MKKATVYMMYSSKRIKDLLQGNPNLYLPIF